MFFRKVCRFVNFTASPKQPQSVTALLITNHNVSKSIIMVKTKMTLVVSRLNAPISSKAPRTNSITHKAMAISKETGVSRLSPKAERYSPTLIDTPTKSAPLMSLKKGIRHLKVFDLSL